MALVFAQTYAIMSEIIHSFSDVIERKMSSISITKKLISHIKKLGRGALFSPKDLLDIAPRDLIDKTLSRLVGQGLIIRVTRGVYCYPKKHPVIGAISPPLDDIAKTIAKKLDQKLQISGAEAAHLFGISTQVPAKRVYYTDGLSRQIKVGNQVLQFKHACPKKMAGAGEKAGAVLQAIRYLGKQTINDDTINMIAKQVDAKDQKSLRQIASFAPDWSRPFLNKISSYEHK